MSRIGITLEGGLQVYLAEFRPGAPGFVCRAGRTTMAWYAAPKEMRLVSWAEVLSDAT